MRMDRSIQDSYCFCGMVARQQARNFYYAFLLLPRAQRRAMCALYAFLRHTDDLADEPGSAAEKLQAIDNWRRELDAALTGGVATWPGLLAMADTVNRYAISSGLLHEVIDGVLMDVQPLRFPTFDDLADYCHHVASVVGLCCLAIWGYRSEGGKAENLAEKCGIALQLTNIIRDVGDDARNGRIYLPLDDLARFGVQPEELAEAGPPRDGVRALLAYEGRRAYQFYDQASMLAPLVSPVGRPVLLTIAGIYRALLDEIVRREYNVLSARVAIPSRRKIAITFKALAGRFTGAGSRLDPIRGPQTSSDSIAAPR